MTTVSPEPAGPGRQHSIDYRAAADAIGILEAHRIMTISTLRPDGWPQSTIVGYANDGLTIYFMILRSSQKYANIKKDDRVSIAVGAEPKDLEETKAVYAGARATEIDDPVKRQRAWKLLEQRHPNLASFELPDSTATVVMGAICKHVSIVDYTKGIGHTEAFAA